ncbi:hypothetical protein Slala03_74810 [Streptomyces lavendulae subsp. lavendulae]|nr:hypothetical protein Slala03_74810 [Streptomyces lavendulae subsp. lavendulae]
MGVFSVLPLIMTQRGLSGAAFGTAQFVNALAAIALTAVLGPLLRRRAGNRPLTGLVAVASVWVGISMAAACAAGGLPWICAALALCAPAEIAWFIAASHTLNRISPPDRRGLYQGVWGASLATASLTAPLLGTWCLTSGGPALLIAANVGAGALGAVLCLPLGRDAARGAPGRSA